MKLFYLIIKIDLLHIPNKNIPIAFLYIFAPFIVITYFMLLI